MLAIITKMTLTQVSTWFANARRRLKKENKMTWEPRNRVEDEDNNNDEEDSGRKSVDDKDRLGKRPKNQATHFYVIRMKMYLTVLCILLLQIQKIRELVRRTESDLRTGSICSTVDPEVPEACKAGRKVNGASRERTVVLTVPSVCTTRGNRGTRCNCNIPRTWHQRTAIFCVTPHPRRLLQGVRCHLAPAPPRAAPPNPESGPLPTWPTRMRINLVRIRESRVSAQPAVGARCRVH